MKKRSRTRRNNLPRKSKLRGMQARLDMRKAHKPADTQKEHYIMPGSMQR